MHPAVLAALLSLGAAAALGVGVTVAASLVRVPSSVEDLWRRVRDVIDTSVLLLGRVLTALVVLLAGFGATILVSYVLGKGAQQLEGSVDRPVFTWFAQHQLGAGWTHAWQTLTQMGSRSLTQKVTLVAAVLLAVARGRGRRGRRGRWWVPLTMLPIGYLFEKFGQRFVKLIVDRGHPPTTLGTWPSGGVARLVVVAGLVIYLGLRWRGAGRRVWLGAWSALAFVATVEAYSRAYLQKHWLTDILGGYAYGALALLAVVAAIAVLDRDKSPRQQDGDRASTRVGQPGRAMPHRWTRGEVVSR